MSVVLLTVGHGVSSAYLKKYGNDKKILFFFKISKSFVDTYSKQSGN